MDHSNDPPATTPAQAQRVLVLQGGGALGAFYVTGSIVVAPRLGAVTLIAVILAGQALASLVVDHYGMVGFDAHPATAGRVAVSA